MIHGKNLIGFEQFANGTQTFQTYNPADLRELPELFVQATDAEVDLAVEKATAAYGTYKKTSGTAKASFLRAIADEIEELGTALIERASAESGLPEGRITGERGRTVNQLRLFASVLEDGSWVEASIDPAMADRKPLPRPDIRKMLQPVGPVVVFTASNFPLAFSTAGGDTASALAAGNPVIVKVHPYHAGTNELVVGAISRAAQKCGMPDGVFSSLNSSDFTVGQRLVLHPAVKSVAFTGSFGGGKSLYELAQSREEPIPVFAEMGSVNPVLLLPEKMKGETENLAATIAGSVNLGAGQFCTNPGVLVALKSNETDAFKSALVKQVQALAPQAMLHENIFKNYTKKTAEIFAETAVVKLSESATGASTLKGRPAVANITGADFLAKPDLVEEIFGPFSILIECADEAELMDVLKKFKGQLTGSVLGAGDDFRKFESHIRVLQEVVGRLIFNGVPTGVEVCYSMHHGGPYPSTTDSRFTSVGVDAIKRFVRPVSFQDAPDDYLPDELKNANPLNIWRRVDGELTRKTI
ncbi:aldehyde dehydrogenase (NADP(+)) [Mangrovibacterium marinum]|uniref:NADP-dependent aldehyde dehydrogenase n=1 Tax=Mangrovibacterium marinum TaxID=1639118 RepID=A0A2T5BYU7_9BACT|nr:aldehyde dehydrogenase (NADP(+)) [Mangrovibacterium marinum]PTN07431.1 NADP-dependent aldehyde dehydrogenase [Mangrovibacterium marinum]